MSAALSAMINGALVSALLTAAVWLAMRAASRRLNAATRYLVWWTVLVIAALLPLCYLPGGPLPRAVAAPSREGLLVPIAPRQAPGSIRPASRAVVTNSAVPARQLRFPIAIAAGSVPRWAGVAWALASVLMLLRLAISWMVLSRRKAHAAQAPPSLAARRDAWLLQCGSSRRRVRIAVSAEIPTPMVAGLRHPVILFPANLLAALNETELDQVGLHEAAHLARGDDFVLVVQRIVEALFALHPVVRWIARRIDLEREIACDDFVVQALGKARPYAACLTRVVELSGGVRASVVAAAAADERSHLTRRVDMLLDKSRHTGTRPQSARLTAMLAVIASAVWLVSRAPAMIVFASPMAPAFASVPPAASATPQPAASPAPSLLVKPAPQALPRPPALPGQAVTADVVTVPVGVREPRNRFVVGLDKAAFRLFEDGVEQEIQQLRVGDEPLSVGLLVDTSAGMGAKFAQVNEAVRQFLQVANPLNEYFVVNFNDEARLAVGFTADRAEVQRQLAQMTPQGGSALFDAVSLAMRQMSEAHNSRKAILVITGAGSGNSGNNPAARLSEEPKLIAELVQGNVTVCALNIAGGNDPPEGLLAGLTAQTGGLLFTAGGDAAVAVQASAQIGLELRNLYGLEYLPRNAAHAGAWRTLRIELVPRRGLPPLTLDYRPGYYEPRR